MEPESHAIEVAQQLFQDEEIPGQLALIKANFQILTNSITALEKRLPLVESVKIVQKVKESLQIEPFSSKLNEVLNKNSGFKQVSNIAKILIGEAVETEERAKLPINPRVLANFASAPIVSVDVERFFSSLKGLLSFNRLKLSDSHIKDQMILQWNQDAMKEL
jgi:hypothetical protein